MKRPSLRRVVHVVGLLILIASVIPFVLYAVPEAGGADQSYVVMSESMSPAIPLGSIVLVEERASPAAYEEGDVITFRTGDDPVPTTHRIHSVQETDDGRAFVTKGDANEDPDSSPISSDQVVGEVTLTIPYAGQVILFANSEYGFYTLIALPLFLLLLDTAWRIVTARTGDEAASDGGSGTASSNADGKAAAATSEPSSNAAVANQESSATFTVTPTDLRVTLGVLFLFTVYSGWTVTQMFTAVTTAVTVGAGFATLAVFGLLLAASIGDDSGSAEDSVEGEPVSTEATDRQPAVPSNDDGPIDAEPSVGTLVADVKDDSSRPTATSEVERDDD